MKNTYTHAELLLNSEAGENKARLLSAVWITGKGPRGGKVNIGQPRYDALNMLAIEHKAEVVSRFVGTSHYAQFQIVGIVVRMTKIKQPKELPPPKKSKVHHNCGEPPPWE